MRMDRHCRQMCSILITFVDAHARPVVSKTYDRISVGRRWIVRTGLRMAPREAMLVRCCVFVSEVQLLFPGNLRGASPSSKTLSSAESPVQISAKSEKGSGTCCFFNVESSPMVLGHQAPRTASICEVADHLRIKSGEIGSSTPLLVLDSSDFFSTVHNARNAHKGSYECYRDGVESRGDRLQQLFQILNKLKVRVPTSGLRIRPFLESGTLPTIISKTRVITWKVWNFCQGYSYCKLGGRGWIRGVSRIVDGM